MTILGIPLIFQPEINKSDVESLYKLFELSSFENTNIMLRMYMNVVSANEAKDITYRSSVRNTLPFKLFID